MNKLFYGNYNSVIEQGNRVRRMRRTELSSEKVITSDNNYMIPSQPRMREKSTKSSRSIPKIEKSFDSKRTTEKTKNTKIRDIQNQYYHSGRDSKTNLMMEGTISKNFYRNSSERGEYCILNSQQNIPEKPKQQYSAEKFKSKTQAIENKSPRVSIRKMEKQEVKPLKIRESSLKIKEEFQESKNQRFSESSCSSQNFNAYELENNNQQFILNSKKSEEEQQNPYNNQFHSQTSSLKASSIKSFSQRKSILKEKLSKIRGSQININYENNEEQSQSEEGSVFQLESQGMSVLKVGSKSGTSKSYIRSLGNESVLNSDKERKEPDSIDKRMGLKLQSIRKQKMQSLYNNTQRNSCKNLPLASKHQSEKRADSFKSKPVGDSLEEVLERIEMHDFIIAQFTDFGEQTLLFYQGRESEYERLCYLLDRKHFLEKSNMIKALKGGKNIFMLSTIEIPSEILKKYLQNEEIKELIRQQEQVKKNLFKKLEKQFKQIKRNYKNDDFVKLETPHDNFSKAIVIELKKQIDDLYRSLEELDGQVLEAYQDRIIDIMEKIFVISELAGRRVKKLEFSEEIEDFDAYYQDNLEDLLQTVEFFQQIKQI